MPALGHRHLAGLKIGRLTANSGIYILIFFDLHSYTLIVSQLFFYTGHLASIHMDETIHGVTVTTL